MRRTTLLLIVGVAALFLLLSSIFIVDEREKALVLQFGQIEQVKENPGLAFKIPLIQEVVRYDDRILYVDTDLIEVTPSDDRRLVVDAFAHYRIDDVVQFRQAVGIGGLRAAEDRLASILTTQVRAVLGSEGVTSNTILSAERGGLTTRIRDEARARAAALGLEVIDVQLKETNLPEQNLEATFARMRAEREREAADEIARGEEAAQRVRAAADRTVVELVSEAQREAEITRGEADAQRSGIYAEAFGKDEEFFEFYRSLAAYQQALQAGNSTMVISPDGEFFDYLKTDQPNRGAAAAPAASLPEPSAGAAAAPSVGGAALEPAPSSAAAEAEVDPGPVPGAASIEAAPVAADLDGVSAGVEPVLVPVETVPAEEARAEPTRLDAGDAAAVEVIPVDD